MQETKIQWTWRQLPDGTMIPGATFNPWLGCFKVAQECKHCYAEGFAKRWGWNVWGPASTSQRRVTSLENWKKPLKWNKEAQAQGHRRSVFCASLADVFEDHQDVSEARSRLWQLISETPWLNWLLLTKRPENILDMLPWKDRLPDNVWLGTSAGTKERAKYYIPALLETGKLKPAVLFVSCEPQLEYVDMTPYLPGLDWMICGGESGPLHRSFDIDWARSLRDQCQYHGVRYFFKQVGGRYHDSGGRMLDGRTWDEIPDEMPMAVKGTQCRLFN